jgi:ATP-dependent DNA helicase RecG
MLLSQNLYHNDPMCKSLFPRGFEKYCSIKLVNGKGEVALTGDVGLLKGVGPKIALRLRAKGITTVEDLLYLLPLRYEDRRTISPISDIREGQRAVILGKVIDCQPTFFHRARNTPYEAVLSDETGEISLKWFRWTPSHLQRVCRKDALLLAIGEVTRFKSGLQIIHPQISLLDDAEGANRYREVIAVYPDVEGIKPADLRKMVGAACAYAESKAEGFIPSKVCGIHGLMSLTDAFNTIHRPDNPQPHDGPDRRCLERLILEEYFLFQAALLLRKAEMNDEEGIPLRTRGPHFKAALEGFPFSLTAGQNRVVDEIRSDMGRSRPMNRLLQGDVGSGKTICAILASCIALDGGCQVAFMAPTEILAEQHYLGIHRLFEKLGLEVAFLRGGMGAERRRIGSRIRSGEIRVVVGTHALLEKDIVFKRLGLVVIDEQHRFGVLQRKTLQEKATLLHIAGQSLPKSNPIPHILVMTATPIPRTLSLVVYGDLDVSVLKELPRGRQSVWTKVFKDPEREQMLRLVGEELERGCQAFMVYPLVEESEKVALLDARSMAKHLDAEVFPGHSVGLLHGRMRPQEKESLMTDFKARRINLLVCTTVIEVGIDVPNAAVIVVEHAERFGLSQLHQLRGRVGRGAHPSKCLLVAGGETGTAAWKRLRILEKTTDGFVIAEEDMRLRGPGEVLGVRQSGLPNFRVGDIVHDGSLMTQARRLAEEGIEVMTTKEKESLAQKAMVRFGPGPGLSHIA